MRMRVCWPAPPRAPGGRCGAADCAQDCHRARARGRRGGCRARGDETPPAHLAVPVHKQAAIVCVHGMLAPTPGQEHVEPGALLSAQSPNAGRIQHAAHVQLHDAAAAVGIERQRLQRRQVALASAVHGAQAVFAGRAALCYVTGMYSRHTRLRAGPRGQGGSRGALTAVPSRSGRAVPGCPRKGGHQDPWSLPPLSALSHPHIPPQHPPRQPVGPAAAVDAGQVVGGLTHQAAAVAAVAAAAAAPLLLLPRCWR